MKIPNEKELNGLLEDIEGRRKVLETSIQTVVEKYTPTLFVYGPPGLGKSHLLRTILNGLCPGDWRHHTAYTTPKALMMSLMEFPNALHCFEDCEGIFKVEKAASLLRAACGGDSDGKRLVSYETANETIRLNFTGSIVVATNENLSRKNGPLQGVASRFRPILWNLSLEERVAIILKISEQGFRRGKVSLSAKECKTVALGLLEWVEANQEELALDIRLFTEHALPTYAYCEQAGVKNWESVLAAKLTGIANTKEERQHERTDRLQDLAVMIDQGQGSQAAKLTDWKQKTGLGKAIFYRHLKNAKKKS